jgi:hypothetical protein
MNLGISKLDLKTKEPIRSLIEIGCRAPEEINLPGGGAMRKWWEDLGSAS